MLLKPYTGDLATGLVKTSAKVRWFDGLLVAGSAVGGLAFEYRGAVWTFVAAALVAVGMTIWSAIVEVQQRAVATGPFSAVEASTPRSVAEVEADWESCWEDNELEEVPMVEDEKDGLTSTHRTIVSSCMDD